MIDFLYGHRMELIFALTALLAACFIWRSLRRMHAATDVNFDLRDLLMENSRVSKAACVMMGSFAATTWYFIFAGLSGKMTEGLFGLYGALWVTPVVARLVSKDSGMPQNVTVTTTDATVEVKK